jgi:branched-subunit amino acid aminotransferase/4-amino-4-deoxychorismate lyase
VNESVEYFKQLQEALDLMRVPRDDITPYLKWQEGHAALHRLKAYIARLDKSVTLLNLEIVQHHKIIAELERTAQHNFDHATSQDHRAQTAEARIKELEAVLRPNSTAAELASRVMQLEEALWKTEADARWIAGQWQRLNDEPVTEVAKAIVDRCRSIRGQTIEQDETKPQLPPPPHNQLAE